MRFMKSDSPAIFWEFSLVDRFTLTNILLLPTETTKRFGQPWKSGGWGFFSVHLGFGFQRMFPVKRFSSLLEMEIWPWKRWMHVCKSHINHDIDLCGGAADQRARRREKRRMKRRPSRHSHMSLPCPAQWVFTLQKCHLRISWACSNPDPPNLFLCLFFTDLRCFSASYT